MIPQPPRRFAETWWGARWIQALERMGGGWSNRLPRGRFYARSGAVQGLTAGSGQVSARVQGRRPEPYEVHIGLPQLPQEVWDRVMRRLATRAIYAAKLLAGEMPRDIQGIFASCRASLFPRRPQELRTSCTCPDTVNPCKHIAAVHYVLAETLDRDPFLLFELRGRTREQVLEALREWRARRLAAGPGGGPGGNGMGGPEPEESAIPLDDGPVEAEMPLPADYAIARGDLTAIGFHVAAPELAFAAIRAMGPPRSWPEPLPFLKAFAPLYRKATALAMDIAWGGEDEVPESARLRDDEDAAALETMAENMPRPLAPGAPQPKFGRGRGQPQGGGPRRRRTGRFQRRFGPGGPGAPPYSGRGGNGQGGAAQPGNGRNVSSTAGAPPTGVLSVEGPAGPPGPESQGPGGVPNGPGVGGRHRRRRRGRRRGRGRRGFNPGPPPGVGGEAGPGGPGPSSRGPGSPPAPPPAPPPPPPAPSGPEPF